MMEKHTKKNQAEEEKPHETAIAMPHHHPNNDHNDDTDVEVKEGSSCFRRHRRLCTCCCIALGLLILLVIILVILAFTVFKPKDPTLDVQDVSVESLNAGLRGGFPPRPSLNLTLGVTASVHNPNKASVRYAQSTTQVFYHGEEVGIVDIPAGELPSDGGETIRPSLLVLADKLILNSNFLSDFLAGSLPFTSSSSISGRVKFLGIFSHHVHVSTSCSFDVSISSRAVENRVCDNRVAL